ncbi:MAG: site-specific integrase [Lachnospiraceae bacterium]|nr:site-specific integrase [Lachnospiraceae bacterium]
MGEKRRDNKNRVLRSGEIQMADGRYRYKYSDTFGTVRYVYSWRLDKNDRMPVGKKHELSLREKEKQIAADMFDRIIPEGGKLTVLELVKKYVSLKSGVRPTTEAGYRTVINLLEKDEFGRKRIDKVRLSDAKAWLIRLQKEGRGYSSIKTVRGVVRPAFQMAFDDDLIRKNPFAFELATVVVNDSMTREAITREQERKLLKFIAEDEHFKQYYDGIYILFHTGLRISEFVGLTISDIDFENMKINVDHQLQRVTRVGYIIEPTKTTSGTRQIPMTQEVAECFRRVIRNRKKPKVEMIIDGYSGFLFLDREGKPMVALHWEKYMKHICQKYNPIYKVQMPDVTPHVCRHTFCSNMAKSGMNPKTLQYIMGHSDIGVTLNTYTHLDFEDASEEVRRLSGD